MRLDPCTRGFRLAGPREEQLDPRVLVGNLGTVEGGIDEVGGDRPREREALVGQRQGRQRFLELPLALETRGAAQLAQARWA